MMPPIMRDKAHEQLDQLLDDYEKGYPLGLRTTLSHVSTSIPEWQLTIYMEEKVY